MKFAPRFLAFLLTLTASMLFETMDCSAAPSRPNVVLIIVDDLGWADVGVYGSDLHQTPNVDRLAQDGTLFTDAYAACTVCSPTRSSIMTGKYPGRSNVTDWITGHVKPYAKLGVPDWTMEMKPEEVTLAEELQDAGYKTIHIGKWHVGEEPKHWPENQGFDENIGGWKAGSPKAHGGGGYFSPYTNPRMDDGPDGEYLTERLAKEAKNYILQNAKSDQPFFLNFWLYNVHTPLQASEEKIAKYQALTKKGATHTNPVYAAMVEHMDDAVGDVMMALRKAKIEEETIVIFSSDNGGLCGNYENNRKKVTKNGPLRSGKGDMFEGGVRVPLIVSWPGKIAKGKTSGELAISPDLYSTILDMTGVKGADALGPEVDGFSFKEHLLTGRDAGREAIYWHYPHYHLEGAKPHSAVRKGDWKLIHVYEEALPQLYNLKNDIGEQKDLFASSPEKAAELMGDLNQWRKEVGAQDPVFNQNYDPQKEDSWIITSAATIESMKEKPEPRKKKKHQSNLYQDGKYKESNFSKALSGGTRILEEEGWNVWGTSPIWGDDGKLHVFFSRWPGGHSNWLRNSEIAHAVADSPEGPYEVLGTVLKGRGPGHWDADTIHNPTIHKVGDRYALFFIGNNLEVANQTGAHHASTQRVGLALADSLYGPWERVGDDPIIETSKDLKDWDSFLTTNPAFLQKSDEQYWLYYKAWDKHNDNLRKMGLAVADRIEGPYKKLPKNPLVSFSHLGKQVEDAYVFEYKKKYYMVMRDMGVIHAHVGLLLESEDGVNWSEPMLGYHTSKHYLGGEVERFERPQILFTDGKPTHLFLALMGGKYHTSTAAVLKIDADRL
ncbi:sulfatase-like hydrolase/transferase [Pelagicoccus mobilis]|uniref:Sulfatase-like hydrolase/transferase n=1 Tax=Pelagicoccus mobilis TaxID=415221 RepID=A0A934RSQ1_9BACT|nr:sulfatase-like hydrolase/transferase [Pelagicoccus mobilis]MBK1876167.1 sulfatase-like hydrolase/transferase [Pelagicoccus mobilis]